METIDLDVTDWTGLCSGSRIVVDRDRIHVNKAFFNTHWYWFYEVN